MTTNDDRAEWAKTAVLTFRDTMSSHGEALDTIISDLICDLRHFCDRGKVDWDDVVRRADYHYQEEVAEAEPFYCHRCLELLPISVLEGFPPASAEDPDNADSSVLFCRDCHPECG